ncbi:epithelial membrane protein 2-like [Solea senegalensis]|nr:epithelial membrane protein 2-like [Solea senegalensis]KAG7506156.1 epithelial membrane protein 2-like [Solea senegalensis]
MLILLAAIFALHIIGIILLLVATIDNAWWVTDTVSTDVWARWILQPNGVWNYTDLPSGSHYPQDYLQAVQASSILACIFSIIGIFVFVAQLFTLEKGQRFTISGIFQLLACLCIMIAASIYTDRFHLDEKFGWYGHCYILAWISFALTFISSITYFVLRKKTA